MSPYTLLGCMFLLAALVVYLVDSEHHARWAGEIVIGAGLMMCIWWVLLAWVWMRYT